MNKRIILNTIGVVFIAWGLIAIIKSISEGIPDKVFWMSWQGLIIIGIACLRRNGFLMSTQLNILAIPTILWSIDLAYALATGQFIFGLSANFFSYSSVVKKIILMEHLIIFPFTIYSLYTIKLERTDMWKISVLQLVLIFFLTIFLTSPETNVNCAFESCLTFTLPNYQIIWFVFMLSSIAITNILIANIIPRKEPV